MTFADWLFNEIHRRRLTQSELARHMGMSQSGISLVLSGERNPGIDFCHGVAKALNIPLAIVLDKAGLVPIESNESPNLKEATHLFRRLSERQQHDILVMMRALIDQDRQVSATTS